MSRYLMISLCAAALVAPAHAADQTRPVASARPPWDGRLMDPERVTDGVWVLRQPDRLWAAVIGNVTIIEQTDGVVLIDSGGSIPDGREVVAAVRHLTPKPIKAVALTHWHNDHPLGVPAVLEAFPSARIISTAATRDFIKSETKVGLGKADAELDAARQKRAADTVATFAAEAAKPSLSEQMKAEYAIENRWIGERIKRQVGNYAVLPTELVSDSLTIDDPASPVELRFLGQGNTHGDLIAWLPRQRTLVSGDIVVAPTPYGFTNPTAPWLETLARLETLPFTILVPGHGRVQHDRSYLATLKWSMTDLAERAKAAASKGLTKEQALTAFDHREQEARFGAADPWTKKWLNDYWLEGMFETAFDEAKGIPASVK